MTARQIRNSAYYKERLKRDHPAIYDDLKAGRYRTVADAAMAAGLKKPRTRLQELKNAWTKADAREQREFLRWLASCGAVPSPTHSPPSSSSSITVDRRLTKAASRRIDEIMSKRRLRPGDVMVEMGYSRLNPSVGMALARGTQLRADIVLSLEKWIASNAAI